MKTFTICILSLLLLLGCGPRGKGKGGSTEVMNDTVNDLRVGQAQVDSLELGTRPAEVLLTGHARYRLIPILKKNWDQEHKSSFFGGIEYRNNYNEDEIGFNVWHSHLMPGYAAACGYNVINVAHFDTQSPQQRSLFDSLVLIKTIYFPAASKDTLEGLPVLRNDYLISVFDEDTNQDGYINQNDLRRFYHFALPGLEKKPLVPRNHSVVSSEYDPGNDWMYVFTRHDENKNGKVDGSDPWHIYWIDMKSPSRNGLMM